MKIQKLFLAVLSSSVLCTSCMDNFLDTESPSIPSDENLFKSTALTEAALMGVYATMTDTYIYGQKLCVNWQGASDVEVGSGAFSTETIIRHFVMKVLAIFMTTIITGIPDGTNFIIWQNPPLLS